MPLIFGTLGALLCKRAGVLNLGIEGITTFGAVAGWLAVFLEADLWTDLHVAALCGALLGALPVTLGLSPHVAGLAITLLATSLAHSLCRLLAEVDDLPRHRALPPDSRRRRHPLAGRGAHPVRPHLARAGRRAAAGLGPRPRAPGPRGAHGRREPPCGRGAGARPPAHPLGRGGRGLGADGLGGAFLTTVAFNSFFPGMVQGRGWICMALVVFASWRPGKAVGGALLFALFDAFQLRLQAAVPGVPYRLFLMAPHLLSIRALVLVARRARVPEALMQPYRRGER